MLISCHLACRNIFFAYLSQVSEFVAVSSNTPGFRTCIGSRGHGHFQFKIGSLRGVWQNMCDWGWTDNAEHRGHLQTYWGFHLGLCSLLPIPKKQILWLQGHCLEQNFRWVFSGCVDTEKLSTRRNHPKPHWKLKAGQDGVLSAVEEKFLLVLQDKLLFHLWFLTQQVKSQSIHWRANKF